MQSETQPKEEEKIPVDKRVSTLFLLLIPSLLIAMSASITSIYIRLSFQVVLLFLQVILIKKLLDSYYG